MCPEEGGAAGLDELRSWWEVPAIAHFCSLFRTAFRLPDFEIEVYGSEWECPWRTEEDFGSPGAGATYWWLKQMNPGAQHPLHFAFEAVWNPSS